MGDRELVVVSKHEFVVIHVWKAYSGDEVASTGFDGRWVSYSRCTASEARTFLEDKSRSKFMPFHWMTGQEVGPEQLRMMAENGPGQWERRLPPVGDRWAVEVTRQGNRDQYVEVRVVAGWTGPEWAEMVQDIAAVTAETGDEVVSIKIS